MPTAENHVLAKGYDAGGPITHKRFIKFDANGNLVQCDTDGEKAYGVSKFSVSNAEIALGKGVSALTQGRATVMAAEAINAGDPVATDATGKAVVADSGDFVLGMCDLAAAGANDECTVDLSKTSAVL